MISRLMLPFCFVVISVGTAQAGSGDCVWNHLSLATRQSALIAGFNGGPNALSAKIPREQLNSSEKLCGWTPTNSDAFRGSEAGYMLQVLAEFWLDGKAQLTPSQLDKAWTKMDQWAKISIEQWATALNHDPEAHELAYRSFVAVLGHPAHLPPDVKPKLMTYIQGRALQEVYGRH